MSQTIAAGATILLRGPASATVITGKIKVFEKPIQATEKIIVRKGKALPLESLEDSTITLRLGIDAGIEEITDATIPHSWNHILDRILVAPKPSVVLVLGDVDTGKTTLCTILTNQAINLSYQPTIIDLDIGQSDIGPPTTIGTASPKAPLADLFFAQPTSIIFTGRTNPHGITEHILLSLDTILARVQEQNPDFIIINTDGWIRGPEASMYKQKIVDTVNPHFIIGIQRKTELENLLCACEAAGHQVTRLPVSPNLKARSPAARRELREQHYKKFLKNLALRSFPINWLRFEYTSLGSGTSIDPSQTRILERMLGSNILHCEETPQGFFIVVDEPTEPDESKISEVETSMQKPVYLAKAGDERGMLVGILNRDRTLLGLGIIAKIDYTNQLLKLHAFSAQGIHIIQFSQVKVTEDGRELGTMLPFFTHY